MIATAALWTWLFAAARIAPIAWWAPPGEDAPLAVRAALGLGLTALVAHALPPVTLAQVAMMSWAARLILIVREAAIGSVIALVAAAPVALAAAAGRLADSAAGLADDGPLTGFTRAAALVVFFGIGGHLAVARALVDSYQALPIGAAPPLTALAGAAQAIAGLTAAGLWIAVPWLITAAIVELGAAAARRASGALTASAPLEAARPIAVIAAVGLGAIASAALWADQIRAALATIGRIWT
jgi:flagellar biosynthetic protein FliR